MPTPTYTPLANITLGSSATSVTFSSISGSYRDLILVMNVSAVTGNWPYFRYNSDSGSNYNFVNAYGDGGSTGSGSGLNETQIYMDPNGQVNTGSEMIKIEILDYSATNKHKTTLHRKSKANGYVNMTASRWASTSAITSIYLYHSGSWAAGSTFALYGVSA